MVLKYFLLFFALIICSSINGQAVTYICDYPVYSSQEDLKEDNNFGFKLSVDVTTSKAFLIGDKGLSEVTISKHDYGLYFIETTPSGNVMTTVIVNETLESVYSRHPIHHSALPDDKVIAALYYGKCRLEE